MAVYFDNSDDGFGDLSRSVLAAGQHLQAIRNDREKWKHQNEALNLEKQGFDLRKAQQELQNQIFKQNLLKLESERAREAALRDPNLAIFGQGTRDVIPPSTLPQVGGDSILKLSPPSVQPGMQLEVPNLPDVPVLPPSEAIPVSKPSATSSKTPLPPKKPVTYEEIEKQVDSVRGDGGLLANLLTPLFVNRGDQIDRAIDHVGKINKLDQLKAFKRDPTYDPSKGHYVNDDGKILPVLPEGVADLRQRGFTAMNANKAGVQQPPTASTPSQSSPLPPIDFTSLAAPTLSLNMEKSSPVSETSLLDPTRGSESAIESPAPPPERYLRFDELSREQQQGLIKQFAGKLSPSEVAKAVNENADAARGGAMDLQRTPATPELVQTLLKAGYPATEFIDERGRVDMRKVLDAGAERYAAQAKMAVLESQAKVAEAFAKIRASGGQIPNKLDEKRAEELVSKQTSMKLVMTDLDSALQIFDDPMVPESQKISQAFSLLKTLNSPFGSDAIGKEEADRLGGFLEFQFGNLKGWASGRSAFIGQDIKKFIDGVRINSTRLHKNVSTIDSEVNSIAKKYGIENAISSSASTGPGGVVTPKSEEELRTLPKGTRVNWNGRIGIKN